jgi:hypothetical protein
MEPDQRQLKLISQTSMEDVEYIAKIKKNVSEDEFYDLVSNILSQFIANEEVVSELIVSGIFTWEISMILEMSSEPWFFNGITFLTNTFRHLMLIQKDKCISIVKDCYPSIHESLACWHDSFFLHESFNSTNPRHVSRSYFKMLGDSIESVHISFIRFIYEFLINSVEGSAFQRQKEPTLGNMISKLIEIDILETIYKTNLHGVSLSQWRNIAQHSSYKYDKKTDKIFCRYGNRNQKALEISMHELFDLLSIFNRLQALQKIAVEFFIVEFSDEFSFLKAEEFEVTMESILGQMANSWALNDYKILSVEIIPQGYRFDIEDSASRGRDRLHEVMPQIFGCVSLLKKKV